MRYNLIPSLEHIILVKIAIRLWSEFEDIEKITSTRHKFYFNNSSWLHVEKKVMKKAEVLPLPPKVRKKIIAFIKSIGFELRRWKKFHMEFISKQHIIRNLNKLYWTQLGKIDRRKTAEKLIRDDSININMRYKLAYIYCLESDISALWYKMQSNFSLKSRFGNLEEMNDEPLVVYWSSGVGIKGFRNYHGPSTCYPNSTRYQRAFENAAFAGNKAATQYFFQKLSLEEKRESVLRSADNIAKNSGFFTYIEYDFSVRGHHREYIDVFNFLLLQMNLGERATILRRNVFSLLVFFFNWPWQHNFIMIVQHAWHYLDVDKFRILLNTILGWSWKGSGYYDYRNLFIEFWEKSSERFKNHITSNIKHETFLLAQLFLIKDEQIIKLILEDTTSIGKKESFSPEKWIRIWLFFLENDDWCSLELFIQHCALSENEIVINGRVFLLYIEHICSKKDKIAHRNFIQLLRDLIEKNDTKKEIEEQISNSVQIV